MEAKRLIVLGATGSVGVSTLEVAAAFPDRFRVTALTGGSNVERIEKQIRWFRPQCVAMVYEDAAEELRRRCFDIDVEILSGVEGLVRAVAQTESDLVVSAIVGGAGLVPTLSAIKSGKTVALANKETLVMAGEMVMAEAKRSGSVILPVDSEHSAIFQALAGHRREDVARLILTASGGPLLDFPIERGHEVTRAQALAHPNWSMGRKISIDSATMMNKALEVIEARWLFGIGPERIKVVIHRQSVIHSMVEYLDGSVIAQLGIPDMRIPIAYALGYPERLPLRLPSLDLAAIGTLSFMEPDPERFPCLGYAFEALKAGGTMPAVLNAANEEAVRVFLEGRVAFPRICEVVRRTMDAHRITPAGTLEDIIGADQWARRHAAELLKEV